MFPYGTCNQTFSSTDALMDYLDPFIQQALRGAPRSSYGLHPRTGGESIHTARWLVHEISRGQGPALLEADVLCSPYRVSMSPGTVRASVAFRWATSIAALVVARGEVNLWGRVYVDPKPGHVDYDGSSVKKPIVPQPQGFFGLVLRRAGVMVGAAVAVVMRLLGRF